MQTEIHQKMAKLRQLSDAICCAIETHDGTHKSALAIQNLNQQRETLRATLPPLTGVEVHYLQQLQQQQGKAT